jgi:UDP-3-O-[3-hydroxymyristoyl] glucosamine N-acyltransferase
MTISPTHVTGDVNVESTSTPPIASSSAYTAQDLAGLLGAELLGPGSARITHLSSVEQGSAGALTFIRSNRYAAGWARSSASAAIVAREVQLAQLIPGGVDAAPDRALLIVADADLALIKALDLFAPRTLAKAPGVHPSAVIEPGAQIDPRASIGPLCTIGSGAIIEAGAVLVARVHVGPAARIGARTVLHPGVYVAERCVIASDCILHPNVTIGADGFGYRPSPDGRGLLKIPHIGNVEIDSHVEIGAGTTIDRAKFGSTTIGEGTKIDNLVQIGHGCRIGRSCVLCGQVGLAGSVVLGDGVVMGGQAGVGDHAEIGSFTKIAACSAITSSIPANAVYMGSPAIPASEWKRMYMAMRKASKRRAEV